MGFAARQLQEKCQEQNTDLYLTYVDLTKAFDTISRDGFGELWQNMAAPKNSSPSLDNFMVTCMQGHKTTEKSL